MQPLFAGGELLWLLFPNWNNDLDLSQYLGALQDMGYPIDSDRSLDFFDSDNQDAALVLGTLSFEVDVEDPDEGDFTDEVPSITLLDFTLNAFNPEFWAQYLHEIRLLLQNTHGWGDALFCELLIHMIHSAPSEDYVYVFTLYYLQLVQERLDDRLYEQSIQRLVSSDIRKNPNIFYQRICVALGCLVEKLSSNIEGRCFAHAFRGHANGLIREIYAQVCPNKRKRGCEGRAPGGLFDLRVNLANILSVLEFAIHPFSSIEVLRQSYEDLNNQAEDGDILSLLGLEVCRAQTASRLSIFHSILIIASQERIKNMGLEAVAVERTRMACRVDDSKSLLKLACLKDKQERIACFKIVEKGKLKKARTKSRNEISNEQQDQKDFQKELEAQSMREVIQARSAMTRHWQRARGLIAGESPPGSEDGTEVLDELSDGSTVIIGDNGDEIQQTDQVLDGDEDDERHFNKRRKLTHCDSDEYD